MPLRIDIEISDSAESGDNVRMIIENVCKECVLGCNAELYAGVHLTGNDDIQVINREFREIDCPTDVLSFPLLTAHDGIIEFTDLDKDSETNEVLLGDIVISTDRAHEQADEYGHSYKREIAFLACHGMLHLMGFDHENEEDEKKMFEKQKDILNKLRYTK